MTRAGLLLLVVLIVLGNGLRSVISSTIFASEGSFASFLSISVDSTPAVTELLMGAVLVSLLVAPWLMRWMTPIGLAMAMSVLAALATLGLAALFYLGPVVDMRIAAVIVLFPLVGFALATLAPISQSWTGLGGESHSKLMLGAWSMAMPLAFLVTPQLVRVIAPRYGLDVFFAGFALVVAVIFVVLAGWRHHLARAEVSSNTPIHGKLLVAALGAVLAFQALTVTVSLAGLAAPATLPLVAVFAGACWYLWRVFSAWHDGEKRVGPNSATVVGLFLTLFLLNVATTGFYDTSFLARHSCSNTLMADRATLAALAQVGAATLATAILARRALHLQLIVIGVSIAGVGLALYLLYPGVVTLAELPVSEPVLFIGSRMITGFGSALATTAVIFALTHVEGKSGGASLMVAFVMIIGTETGLEAFELVTQVDTLLTGATSAPFGAIFMSQVVIAALALLPVLSVWGSHLRHRQAAA